MRASVKSDIGLARQTNEDSYICDHPIYIVADGMGGHVAGEVASKMVTVAVKEAVQAKSAALPRSEDVLTEAILEANALVLQKAKQQAEYAGMGTTISMFCVDRRECLWAHVGDSRIYLLRQRRMTQITRDHSLVWDLVEKGAITKEESLTHPRRNLLTRAVGVDEDLQIDTGRLALRPGDRVLLCTDGLTNMVGDEEIQEIISSADIAQSVNALIDRANQNGGIDNITALLIENDEPC